MKTKASDNGDRGEPARLDERAAENLRFIRETMEQSSRFTDLPGTGMIVIGLTAAVASFIAAGQTSDRAWTTVWQSEAVLAVLIGLLAAVRKADGDWERLAAGPGRKFVLGLAPPLLAGALLTVVLQRQGVHFALPGTWMLLYGAAVVAAGAYSVRIVPAMGASFMACGALALFAPSTWVDVLMGLGFGGLHIVFGLIVARRYGG